MSGSALSQHAVHAAVSVPQGTRRLHGGGGSNVPRTAQHERTRNAAEPLAIRKAWDSRGERTAQGAQHDMNHPGILHSLAARKVTMP